MPKRLVLSNGCSVVACVGDGFDGDTIVYFKTPMPDDKPEVIEIPEADREPLAVFLEQYIAEALVLRRQEGAIYHGNGRCCTSIWARQASPYQIEYLVGHLRGAT